MRIGAANPAPKISKTETERPGEIVHVLGPANATVTLEEFGDFQCPPCSKLSEPLNQLQKRYNLRVIYRGSSMDVVVAVHPAVAAMLESSPCLVHITR